MTASTKRYTALDVLRGMTVAGMILVNNPGTWSHIFPPLRHAAWNGCTPTDLVFPFFLFVVGAAMAFSFAKFAVKPSDIAILVRSANENDYVQSALQKLGLSSVYFSDRSSVLLQDNGAPTKESLDLLYLILFYAFKQLVYTSA